MNEPSAADLVVPLSGATQTLALGGAIASTLRSGDVVILLGELGAGKTTLVQGIVGALSPTALVTSPTFALCHLYQSQPLVAHVDCWRMRAESELDDLDLEAILEDGGIALIEWGELAATRFGADALVVELGLSNGAERARLARLKGRGEFRERLALLEVSCRDVSLEPQLDGRASR